MTKPFDRDYILAQCVAINRFEGIHMSENDKMLYAKFLDGELTKEEYITQTISS